MCRKALPALEIGDVGTVAVVRARDGGGAKRLADFGFVRGARVEMVRPGRPCIVRVDSACIGLGSGYQGRIELEVVAPA